ncbi:hypothetical protein ACGF07_20795 [Kitasatospora sp. NPDC048194]|uniref:hypothetical protein n=1 Tax=Kitasatospora sp. NPDC048194 TaxID=3364045 RepID=UPI003712FFB1
MSGRPRARPGGAGGAGGTGGAGGADGADAPGGTGGAGGDFDTAADGLYGLAPSAFTRARDQAAADARRAGDRALAARIKGLHRPTVAAYALNRLARDHAAELGAYLDLGRDLRRAQAELAGPSLRELSARRHRVVTALTSRAREAAAAGGVDLAEGQLREIEESLRAASADEGAAAALAAGRLTTGIRQTSGLPALPDVAVAPEPGPEPQPEQQRGRTTRPRPAREARAEEPDRSAADQEARRRARAEAARAEAAQAEAAQARAARAEAEQEHRAAVRDHDRLTRRAEQLAADRERADHRVEKVRAELRQAQQRSEAAAAALARCEAERDTAATRVADTARRLREAEDRVAAADGATGGGRMDGS